MNFQGHQIKTTGDGKKPEEFELHSILYSNELILF